MISLPKWETYTLPAFEKVHIFKDPIKSYTTRKKERVEWGDVSHRLRENPDYTSDNINYHARGVNPMVSVSYGQQGQSVSGGNLIGSTTTVRHPYKVARDGAFRPPLFRQEDLLPLSRQRRPEVVVRPGLAAPGQPVQTNVESKLDKAIVKATVHPMASYNMGRTAQPHFHNKVLDRRHWTLATHPGEQERIALSAPTPNLHAPLHHTLGTAPGQEGKTEVSPIPTHGIMIQPSISVTTGFGTSLPTVSIANLNANSVSRQIKDRPIVSYLTPVFNVEMADGGQRWSPVLNEKEKLRIAYQVEASQPLELPSRDGNPIRLKDYRWSVFQPNPSVPATLIIEDRSYPLRRGRNNPITSITTNLELQGKDWTNATILAPKLNRRSHPVISAFAAPGRADMVDKRIHEAHLQQRISAGAYEERPELIARERTEISAPRSDIDPYKASLSKQVHQQYMDRFTEAIPAF